MYIINNEVFLLYSTKYIMFIYTRLTSSRIFINCKLYKCAGPTPTADRNKRKRLKEKNWTNSQFFKLYSKCK